VTPHRTRSGVGADDEVAAANNKLISYWDSPEAAILFGFNYHNKEDVFTGLEERVELLQGVFVKSDGYRDVVANSYEQSLSDYQVFQIRNKCLFLLNAYRLALEKMGKENNGWVKCCCREAVDLVNSIGINTTTNANVLAKWNTIFRRNGKFPHPDPYIANGKPKPPLFDLFPKAAADASAFILNHLENFSVEMLTREFIAIIIPALKNEVEEDEKEFEENSDAYNLLCHYSTIQATQLSSVGYTIWDSNSLTQKSCTTLTAMNTVNKKSIEGNLQQNILLILNRTPIDGSR
jgi:hypothetical protein